MTEVFCKVKSTKLDNGFLNGPFPGSFFFIFVFSIQLTVNKCSINFADDWIRTADLWNRKRSLYQLSHNHCPKNVDCDTCIWEKMNIIFASLGQCYKCSTVVNYEYRVVIWQFCGHFNRNLKL